MADNAPFKSDGLTVVFYAAADEVTFSGDICKVQLVRVVSVTGAEGSKTVVDISPSSDYTHNSVLTPASTAGPAMVLRAISSPATAVDATDSAVLATGTMDGKVIVQPFANPESTWSYAPPSGGLVTTAEVEAKAAVVGKRNYVTGMQACNSHQTIGTEISILDGPAGTVLWRGWAQFTGGGTAPPFQGTIRGSVNKSIIIKETTATPVSGAYGGVLWNLQGHESKV